MPDGLAFLPVADVPAGMEFLCVFLSELLGLLFYANNYGIGVRLLRYVL